MHTIKFSHKYLKFPDAYQVNKLSQVVLIDESEISDSFREYDTAYWRKPGKKGYYQLPTGKALLLLLLANEGKGWLWTTIRRWTPEKEKYYRSICGENVRIEVEEK